MIFCSWVISWSPSLCRRAGRGPSSWCEPRPASGASAKTNNDCQIKFELLQFSVAGAKDDRRDAYVSADGIRAAVGHWRQTGPTAGSVESTRMSSRPEEFHLRALTEP